MTLKTVEIRGVRGRILVEAIRSHTDKISCGDYKMMHLVPLSFLGFPIGRGFKTALVTFST